MPKILRLIEKVGSIFFFPKPNKSEMFGPNSKIDQFPRREIILGITVPIAEILSGKNARAWVSMVLYLKK